MRNFIQKCCRRVLNPVMSKKYNSQEGRRLSNLYKKILPVLLTITLILGLLNQFQSQTEGFSIQTSNVFIILIGVQIIHYIAIKFKPSYFNIWQQLSVLIQHFTIMKYILEFDNEGEQQSSQSLYFMGYSIGILFYLFMTGTNQHIKVLLLCSVFIEITIFIIMSKEELSINLLIVMFFTCLIGSLKIMQEEKRKQKLFLTFESNQIWQKVIERFLPINILMIEYDQNNQRIVLNSSNLFSQQNLKIINDDDLQFFLDVANVQIAPDKNQDKAQKMSTENHQDENIRSNLRKPSKKLSKLFENHTTHTRDYSFSLSPVKRKTVGKRKSLIQVQKTNSLTRNQKSSTNIGYKPQDKKSRISQGYQDKKNLKHHLKEFMIQASKDKNQNRQVYELKIEYEYENDVKLFQLKIMPFFFDQNYAIITIDNLTNEERLKNKDELLQVSNHLNNHCRQRVVQNTEQIIKNFIQVQNEAQQYFNRNDLDNAKSMFSILQASTFQMCQRTINQVKNIQVLSFSKKKIPIFTSKFSLIQQIRTILKRFSYELHKNNQRFKLYIDQSNYIQSKPQLSQTIIEKKSSNKITSFNANEDKEEIQSPIQVRNSSQSYLANFSINFTQKSPRNSQKSPKNYQKSPKNSQKSPRNNSKSKHFISTTSNNKSQIKGASNNQIQLLQQQQKLNVQQSFSQKIQFNSQQNIQYNSQQNIQYNEQQSNYQNLSQNNIQQNNNEINQQNYSQIMQLNKPQSQQDILKQYSQRQLSEQNIQQNLSMQDEQEYQKQLTIQQILLGLRQEETIKEENEKNEEASIQNSMNNSLKFGKNDSSQLNKQLSPHDGSSKSSLISPKNFKLLNRFETPNNQNSNDTQIKKQYHKKLETIIDLTKHDESVSYSHQSQSMEFQNMDEHSRISIQNQFKSPAISSFSHNNSYQHIKQFENYNNSDKYKFQVSKPQLSLVENKVSPPNSPIIQNILSPLHTHNQSSDKILNGSGSIKLNDSKNENIDIQDRIETSIDSIPLEQKEINYENLENSLEIRIKQKSSIGQLTQPKYNNLKNLKIPLIQQIKSDYLDDQALTPLKYNKPTFVYNIDIKNSDSKRIQTQFGLSDPLLSPKRILTEGNTNVSRIVSRSSLQPYSFRSNDQNNNKERPISSEISCRQLSESSHSSQSNNHSDVEIEMSSCLKTRQTQNLDFNNTSSIFSNTNFDKNKNKNNQQNEKRSSKLDKNELLKPIKSEYFNSKFNRKYKTDDKLEYKNKKSELRDNKSVFKENYNDERSKRISDFKGKRQMTNQRLSVDAEFYQNQLRKFSNASSDQNVSFQFGENNVEEDIIIYQDISRVNNILYNFIENSIIHGKQNSEIQMIINENHSSNEGELDSSYITIELINTSLFDIEETKKKVEDSQEYQFQNKHLIEQIIDEDSYFSLGLRSTRKNLRYLGPFDQINYSYDFNNNLVKCSFSIYKNIEILYPDIRSYNNSIQSPFINSSNFHQQASPQPYNSLLNPNVEQNGSPKLQYNHQTLYDSNIPLEKNNKNSNSFCMNPLKLQKGISLISGREASQSVVNITNGPVNALLNSNASAASNNINDIKNGNQSYNNCNNLSSQKLKKRNSLLIQKDVNSSFNQQNKVSQPNQTSILNKQQNLDLSINFVQRFKNNSIYNESSSKQGSRESPLLAGNQSHSTQTIILKDLTLQSVRQQRINSLNTQYDNISQSLTMQSNNFVQTRQQVNPIYNKISLFSRPQNEELIQQQPLLGINNDSQQKEKSSLYQIHSDEEIQTRTNQNAMLNSTPSRFQIFREQNNKK